MAFAESYELPVGRSSSEQISTDRLLIDQSEFVNTLMEAMPSMAMILNEHRQILSANQRLAQALGLARAELLAGMRLGEALGCIRHSDGPDGCGTAPYCSVCGAALAVFTCQKRGKHVTGECRLTTVSGIALDLEGAASPLNIAGRSFTIFVLKDISSEKRKQVMERTFFHDIINTAGGIRGLAGLLLEHLGESQTEYPALMVNLSDNLIEEIRHQRRLLAAERGEYVPQLEEVELVELLQDVCNLYGHNERVPGRLVRLNAEKPCRLQTDPPVLRRIIGNMLMNALEATDAGEVVEVKVDQAAKEVVVTVTNLGEMPLEVQLQIFQRSFSSKGGSGRGIGTYSMKLFGERYLGGEVGFCCKDGVTSFHIRLPKA